MDKVYINLESVDAGINRILDTIKRKGIKYDYVVGVGRGGLVPATLLAYKLDIPILCYSLSSYKGMKRGDMINHQEPDFSYKSDDKSDKPINIIVIDDICDSGETFNYIKGIKKEIVHTETYASVFARKSNMNATDIFGYATDDDEWIVFPWECDKY